MGRVRFGQRGYVGQSRSVRAQIAEQDGLLPLTRAAAQIAAACGVTVKMARRCLERVGADEWHHVGKFASECEYFDATYYGRAARMARLYTPAAERERNLARAAKRAAKRAASAADRAERERRERAAEVNARRLRELVWPEW